jgi:hypothetical protein
VSSILSRLNKVLETLSALYCSTSAATVIDCTRGVCSEGEEELEGCHGGEPREGGGSWTHLRMVNRCVDLFVYSVQLCFIPFALISLFRLRFVSLS